MLETVDTLLKLSSMIDMDVTCKMRVTLFIYLNHSIKQMLDTFSGTADRRYYRHSKKIT